ncbi:hypothetical protein F5Y04DRAFT_242238 [Hypomontagnella monticulosa]|nr:hypothetical protein F5Y04DRAFT_242238 [Hypomontagnella monticulosa]
MLFGHLHHATITMSNQSQVRSSQRTVLACTECARRKIRCSKAIPCTYCIRHNKASTCHREPVAVVSRRATTRRSSPEEQHSSNDILRDAPIPTSADTSGRVESILTTHPNAPDILSTPNQAAAVYTSPAQLIVAEEAADVRVPVFPDIPNSNALQVSTPGQASDRRLTNEAAAALQFLAHGRRNVLNRLAGRQDSFARAAPSPSFGAGRSEYGAPWDIFFSAEDVRMLLAFHQAHLTWMHQAVYLPTFRQEFEENILQEDCDKSWIALYYAILSHTLFHADATQLSTLPQPIIGNVDIARLLFDKSIDTLFRAGFMAEHRLTSVQTICLLLQVAHNFDKSDLICILISTAIRISQCLNLHRLGADRELNSDNEMNSNSSPQELIDREVAKRIWWFLVRYDWFQIPFQSLCQVHPAQFNTPMPNDTFDEPELMVHNGALATQPPEVCTPSCWANALNQMSVPIWKHQDRIQKIGYPTDDKDNLSKSYDQVIWADREIKRIYASWPAYLREVDETLCATVAQESCFPVRMMPALILLSTAHKILIIHRHFQLSSFRDRRFAFTQLSCVTIAERAIEAIQPWPDTADSRIARRMWTTLTFVISCSIALIFVLLFKSENCLTFDLVKIRHLVEFSRNFIRKEEQTSSIARRGVRLLDALMDLEQRPGDSADIETDIGDIVRRVAAADGDCMDASAAEVHGIVFPYGQDVWGSFMENYASVDFLDMNLD